MEHRRGTGTDVLHEKTADVVILCEAEVQGSKNSLYSARVSPLKTCDFENAPEQLSHASQQPIGGIRFRPLCENDREEIRVLHEEWFPVRYKNSFYDSIVSNRMAKTGDPIFSSIAIVSSQSADDYSNRRSGNAACLSREQSKLHCNQTNLEGDRIVGCVVGAFFECEKISKDTTGLLIVDPWRHSRLFYIMTLGTVHEYRHQGLGSTLVQQCLDLAEEEPHCGAVYLHVITYNTAAIRFYEKLGFVRVDEIEDYYSISGENHNCFLYAKYCNGNRGHQSWSLVNFLSTVVSSMWKVFTIPFYTAYTSLRIKSS